MMPTDSHSKPMQWVLRRQTSAAAPWSGARPHHKSKTWPQTSVQNPGPVDW